MEIDLHIHSTCSDGKLTPRKIVEVASKNKLSTISITDHDCIDAYTEELFNCGKNEGVNIIPGVEISSKYKNISVHVLGYNVDLTNKVFVNKMEELKNVRVNYFNEVSQKLEAIGYTLRKNNLLSLEVIAKSNIANDIIANEVNKDVLIEYFGYIPSMGEFIESIMNIGCPAYVEKLTISTKDAGELIRSAGGKVVLAHPVAYKFEKNLGLDEVNDIVKELKPDGIEAIYIYKNKDNEVINEIDKWTRFAVANDLFITAGSDYHNESSCSCIGFINHNISCNANNIIKDITN